MAFGGRPARSIRDPLIEPAWPGRRVLIHIVAGEDAQPAVEIRDELGLPLAGHPDLQAALIAAARAADVVLDGYLLPLPSLDAALAATPAGPEAPGLGSATRHLFLGARSPGRTAGRSPGRTAGRFPAPVQPTRAASADAPAGAVLSFMAVDLLSLDEEPLLDVPLLERKRLLDGVLVVGDLVRRSPHVRLPAASWYRQWRALGLREMAVKDANSRYRPGETSEAWSIAPIPQS